MTKDIFSTLSKYGSQQAENYLTEAFVFQLYGNQNYDKEKLISHTYPIEEVYKNGIQFYLDLQEVHFFCLNKDLQLEKITEFIKTCDDESQKAKTS